MSLYESTLPLEDTVALDSPVRESGLQSIDMNTQVLGGFESAQQSGYQMNDCFEKGIALDSDDEGENRYEAGSSANECCGATGRLSGRGGIALLRRQQAPADYFRRLNKVKKHVLGRLDSDISGRSDEETAAERIGPCNDYRFQEHHMAVERVFASSSEQKLVSMKPVNTEEKLLTLKLSPKESKCMDAGKDTNYDSKRPELIASSQVLESQDKALQFVENYLSVCDLGSQKHIPSRKTDMIKSPPCLRVKGAQSLARRLTLESTASKLATFDWADKQIDETEYASPRLCEDSAFEYIGDKPGSVTVNQDSTNVKLQNEISNLQSGGKLPENMSIPNNLDTVWLSSHESEEVGSNPGMFIAPDSMKLDEQLDAEISRQNAENVEQLRLTPDELCIGLDTQMAAEAMEELVHASPPRVDARVTHQGSNNPLLNSSNALNNETKSNGASVEVAFVDWICKEKRSKTMKNSSFHDKTSYRVAAKRVMNQLKTVSRPRVRKSLTTKKLMAEEFFNDGTKMTINGKTAAPSRITLQQEEYGIAEKCSSKEFQKLNRACSRRPNETADGIKYDPPAKGKKISSSFRKGSQKRDISRTCLKSNSGSSLEVVTGTAKDKENSYPDLANTTLSRSNPWVYPKGKRTRVFTPHHTVSLSNQSFAFSSSDINLKKLAVEEAVGRVAKLIVHKRRQKVSLGRENAGSSIKLAINLSSPVTDSAVPGTEVKIPVESDSNKPVKHDETANDALAHMKVDLLLSKGHSAKRKRLSLSPLSRSPLMKELTRLGYPDSMPDFLPKDSRRRRATEKVCVLFSQNLDTSKLKQQKRIVTRLGFSIASCSSDATHFVADRFVRTRNMLEAISLGKHVVTHLWLESCEQAGYNVDEKSYILRDEKKEKEFGFNMHVTLMRASKHPLLKGRRVLITPNVKPGLDVINSLVKAVQGEVVQSILKAKKDQLIHNDVLILSSVEDYTICLQYLHKGASIYDSELLLNGIVTQELQYERYRLFKDRKEKGH
ncbi:hypothetical protein SASPL_120055 [Salvia splendens]|uniref:BRCT domain-containing protein n=1 Tax=Salvia splendens TaxID=180675 RepID=A0A8X8XTT8_SALSN|nr:uncharacterized protein LOC121811333 [Salvia splendens]KAG6417858.1 hypothetical protein SASPL_120055 [Salvia splendens]